MKKVLLDTSFILAGVENKIQFIDELLFLGMKIIIPKQVIEEIKKVSNSNKKQKIKQVANSALKIIEKEKSKFQNIELEGRGYTDKVIIKFLKKNKSTGIATLDKELKAKIQNFKVIIRNKKNLEIL